MNSWKYITSGLISICLFSTCSEDFQLTEPYKDIPVIYGIINRSDSTQYFRIEKAYVDENIPASEIAQRPDSLYYINPVVKLYNLKTHKECTLTRVDGNNEIKEIRVINGKLDTVYFKRIDGPFATAPNYLYKFGVKDITLNDGDSVRLELNRNNGSPLVYSKIALVSKFNFEYPGDNIRQLKLFYGSVYPFQWKNKSNTSVFDLKARIYIDELNLFTQETKSVFIDIPLGSGIPGATGKNDNYSTLKVYGSSFYNNLHEQLTPVTGIERSIDRIEFFLTGGGPEISEYNTILNANTGITASQEIPRYSNISEGFGIFSSVLTIVKRITLEDPTIDSLKVHPLTRDLNFK
jgi:hypothetical protein